MENMN